MAIRMDEDEEGNLLRCKVIEHIMRQLRHIREDLNVGVAILLGELGGVEAVGSEGHEVA